jgi:hypothetical protein
VESCHGAWGELPGAVIDSGSLHAVELKGGSGDDPAGEPLFPYRSFPVLKKCMRWLTPNFSENILS